MKQLKLLWLPLLLALGTPQHAYSQNKLSEIIKEISDGIKERKKQKKIAKLIAKQDKEIAKLIAEQKKEIAKLIAEQEKKEAELKAEEERKKAELREQFTLQNSKLLEDETSEKSFKVLLSTLQLHEDRELTIQDSIDAVKVVPAMNFLYGKEVDESKALLAIKEIADQGNSVASLYYASLESRGYRPGFPNGDRIFYGVDWGNNDCLGNGTILHKKNGVLKVIGGKMVFTMNDGTIFTGYFKEQVRNNSYDEVAERRIANFPELTPWNGEIKYPDGRTDNLVWGKSEKGLQQKEQQKEKDAYNTLCKKFGKRYVDAAVNGQILVGMPENLMVATFKAQLYGQSGSRKTYRIYGYGAREYSDEIIISNDHLLMTVWVSGGKVTSFRKWK